MPHLILAKIIPYASFNICQHTTEYAPFDICQHNKVYAPFDIGHGQYNTVYAPFDTGQNNTVCPIKYLPT